MEIRATINAILQLRITTKISRSILLSILLFFFVLQFLPYIAFSENSTTRNEQAGSRYITNGNLSSFEGSLPDPIAQMIRDKKFVIQIKDSLSYEWNYSREWMAASEANVNRFELNLKGEMISQDDSPLTFGWPFSSEVTGISVIDPVIRAQMIIWNMQSLSSIGGGTLYRGAYTQVSNAGPFRRSFFSLLRLFDGRQTENDKVSDTVFFRELFSFTAPSLIRGFSLSTTRYQRGRKTEVSLHSPVLAQSSHPFRKLTEISRSEPLLDGNLSLDDMFMFSADPSNYSLRVVDRRQIYVPFVGDSKLLAEETTLTAQILSDIKPFSQVDTNPASAKCLRGPYTKNQNNNAGSMAKWQFESQDYGSRTAFATWTPLSPIFSSRDMWIIEILPKDPFSQCGKRILFVDSKLYIPFYILEYDRIGRYKKLALASWTLASDGGMKNQVPVLGFVLGLDKDANYASIFEIDQMCFNLRGKLFTQDLFNLSSQVKNAAKEFAKYNDATTQNVEPNGDEPTEVPPID